MTTGEDIRAAKEKVREAVPDVIFSVTDYGRTVCCVNPNRPNVAVVLCMAARVDLGAPADSEVPLDIKRTIRLLQEGPPR